MPESKEPSREETISKFVEELNRISPDNTGSSEKSAGLDRNEVLSGAKAGEVFSIKSHKPISLSEKGRIVNQQIKDVEQGPTSVDNFESVSATSERVVSRISPEFEKARSEWKEARDRAHKIEEEYRQKYQEHVLAQTKGIRGLVNVPRRMFGLHPRLNRELESLQEASLTARIDYKEASLRLKETKIAKDKTIGEIERLTSRYQRMLAHHLTVAVHKERLKKQKDGMEQAWKESKYLRPTVESLAKHKYTVGAVTLGAGILTAGIVPVAAGVVAGVSTRIGLGKILDKTYVESSRKNLIEGKKSIGKDFFEAELSDIDDEIEHLTFAVDTREARAKIITNTAAIAAGISAAGYMNGLNGVEQVTIDTPDTDSLVPKSPTVDSVTPEVPKVESGADLPPLESPTGDSLVSSPEAEAIDDVSSEPNTIGESGSQSESGYSGTDTEVVPKPTTGRADNAISELSRSGGVGVERVDSNIESVSDTNKVETLVKDKTVPEVARDYSLPPYSSVNDLPAIGIIESVPQTPVESSALAENPNLTPVTEAEATAAFGPVTGPSIENLQSADLVTHTVEKGDNVWNILEGKGSDTNPIGGKSEVLEGMNMSDRQSALDKLIEYAEQNPEFAKEVGAVKSDGDIHRVYPGEEINVSMLDDKLRELLGANEVAPESVPASEANVPVEEVGEVDVHEPTTPKVVEEPTEIPDSETATEVQDINNMRVGDILSMQEAVENGDPQILAKLNGMGFDKDSYEALNEAISSNIRSGETYDMTLPLTEWMNQYGQAATPESAPALPQTESSPIPERASDTPNDSGAVVEEAITPVVGNAETAAAVNKYVTGIEKSSGLIFTKPDVSGTFESLKGLSIAEFKAMAGNDNLPTLLEERGVSFDGFMRWGETLQDQVKLIPANDTETIGDYVTRIVKANVRTA